MSWNFEVRDAYMSEDRRLHQRLMPHSPPPVYLGESRSGLLFDFSEGGLAVDCLPADFERREPIISVAFDLPGGGANVRASAEIVWTNDVDCRTGLRFVDLSEFSLQPLREWIAASGFAVALPALEEVVEPETAVESAEVVEFGTAGRFISLPVLPVARQQAEGELARLRTAISAGRVNRLSRIRRRAVIFLAVVIFAPASFFLGHVLANWGYKPQAVEPLVVASSARADANKLSKTLETPPATTPAPSGALSFDKPGFVLQVGAMIHESNADVMRTTLAQKNFPVFAVRRGSDRFYKVCVGPYADADTAAKVKDQLETQGFKAIVKQWSPD
jgi:cell division septation protein DedD